MANSYPSLSKMDCDAMATSVGECLVILSHKEAPLSVAELKMKSMLASLLLELRLHAEQLAQPGAQSPGRQDLR